ncbi:unnamed protein product [Cylindrotheca closterium]|uniref:Subtilisin n=1 Tax=Cylindrotheca closterium TaxID=2856 RepID=A0AAD2JJG3_9STRA|nr:unnamed protein product [Cylindrotheca closterium]
MTKSMKLVCCMLLLLSVVDYARAFSAPPLEAGRTIRQNNVNRQRGRSPFDMVTIEAPTKEDIERETRRRQGGDDDSIGDKEENFEDELRTKGPLEWLEDAEASREMDDPYHILLLGQTFEKPKITVPYVSNTLQYVLEMPEDEATELSQFSFENGMSCLGTWPREECLTLGRQLQVRDIVCRVVPFCEGGQRGWQAKDADEAGYFNARDMQ